MFCTKCGKQIEQGIVCNECAAKEYAQSVRAACSYKNTEESILPEQPKGNRMLGFGKALTAAILSEVGFLFAYIGFLISDFNDGETRLILSLLVLPLIIIPIIFGASSIKVFRSARGAKPIATLVLGIAGLCGAAITAFIDLIALWVALMLI